MVEMNRKKTKMQGIYAKHWILGHFRQVINEAEFQQK